MVYILYELWALTLLLKGLKSVIGFSLHEVSEDAKTERSNHILRLH